MSLIENKKMQLELIRVQAAKMDMEIRIEEAKEEIKRLESFVLIQEDKEKEIIQKLKQ